MTKKRNAHSENVKTIWDFTALLCAEQGGVW